MRGGPEDGRASTKPEPLRTDDAMRVPGEKSATESIGTTSTKGRLSAVDTLFAWFYTPVHGCPFPCHPATGDEHDRGPARSLVEVRVPILRL